MTRTQTTRSVGRPREFDEEQVLTAVMEAFWRKGYEATSLIDLTTSTGLNKASLYRVFGDKHQLFMSALKNYADIEFRETTAVVSEVVSPLTNLRAIVKKVFKDVDSSRGCLMINSIVELAPHDPAVKQLLQHFGEQRLQKIHGLIVQAQEQGEIRSELDPYKLAVSLMIAFAGSAAMVKGFFTAKQIGENLENLIRSWT